MNKESQFNCLNCGSQRTPKAFVKGCSDYYLRTDAKVDYFSCSECGLVQVFPIPEDISALYEAYPVHSNKSKLHNWLRKAVMAPAYFNSALAKPGAVLLDYGCGDGWFLESQKDRPLSLLGFEPSAELAQNLRRRLEIPIYSELERLVCDYGGRVDIVTMHFVMEHLADLAGTFRYVQRLLKPGGTFFFTVPDLYSWEAKLFGRKWHGLDPPRHISFPNKAIVEDLARRHSLEVTRVRPVPFPNGFAGSIPSVLLGHFNVHLYRLALPCGILLSRVAPGGICSYSLRHISSSGPNHCSGPAVSV